MLSVSGLSPGRADYYVEQVAAGLQYYTGDQAEPGRWAGSAAEKLGSRASLHPKRSVGCSQRSTPARASLSAYRGRRQHASGASTFVSAPQSR